MANIWQHYKGGVYNVLHMATHTETNEGFVVYQDGKGKVWVRPFEMFFEMIEVDGVELPRFVKLGDFK